MYYKRLIIKLAYVAITVLLRKNLINFKSYLNKNLTYIKVHCIEYLMPKLSIRGAQSHELLSKRRQRVLLHISSNTSQIVQHCCFLRVLLDYRLCLTDKEYSRQILFNLGA